MLVSMIQLFESKAAQLLESETVEDGPQSSQKKAVITMLVLVWESKVGFSMSAFKNTLKEQSGSALCTHL